MTKELLVKYLQGKCSEVEFAEIIDWIKNGAQSASGKTISMEVWDEYEPELEGSKNINGLLDKIHHKININQNTRQFLTRKQSSRSRILSIVTQVAAIMLLPVMAIFLFFIFSNTNHYTNNLSDLEVSSPVGAVTFIELGDGTKVWLNHGSSLKYPYRFEDSTRMVFLSGEAFFEVAHDENTPFIVETKYLDVKATGTAFNVSAYADEDAVETTLVEGQVILLDGQNNKEIKTLTPGDYLKFDFKANSYVMESGNALKHTAWKDGKLIFQNDMIEVVVKKLARWYNVDAEISNHVFSDYSITATFTDETLPQVLEMLSLVTPVSFQLRASEKMPDGSYSKQKIVIGIKK